MSEHWLISGANRGIGLELARQLAARGDHVTAGLRTSAARDALNARLAPQHAEIDALLFDARDDVAIRHAAAAVTAARSSVHAAASA